MVYYSIIDVTVTEGSWLAAYGREVNDIVARYGGRYIAKTGNHTKIEGKEDSFVPATRIIMKWPSKEAALGFMNDAGYKPHLERRTKGSISNHYLIEGLDEL